MYVCKVYDREKKKVSFSFKTDSLGVVYAQVTPFMNKRYAIYVTAEVEGNI